MKNLFDYVAESIMDDDDMDKGMVKFPDIKKHMCETKAEDIAEKIKYVMNIINEEIKDIKSQSELQEYCENHNMFFNDEKGVFIGDFEHPWFLFVPHLDCNKVDALAFMYDTVDKKQKWNMRILLNIKNIDNNIKDLMNRKDKLYIKSLYKVWKKSEVV